MELPESVDISKAINDAMRAIKVENEDLRDVLPKTCNRLRKERIGVAPADPFDSPFVVVSQTLPKLVSGEVDVSEVAVESEPLTLLRSLKESVGRFC